MLFSIRFFTQTVFHQFFCLHKLTSHFVEDKLKVFSDLTLFLACTLKQLQITKACGFYIVLRHASTVRPAEQTSSGPTYDNDLSVSFTNCRA